MRGLWCSVRRREGLHRTHRYTGQWVEKNLLLALACPVHEQGLFQPEVGQISGRETDGVTPGATRLSRPSARGREAASWRPRGACAPQGRWIDIVAGPAYPAERGIRCASKERRPIEERRVRSRKAVALRNREAALASAVALRTSVQDTVETLARDARDAGRPADTAFRPAECLFGVALLELS